MYVLVHKNRVLAGPMNWNRAIFDGNLEKLKIIKTLPKVPPDNLPFIIDDNTKIYKAEFNYPEYNEKINYLEGPYWEFNETQAIASYIVRNIPIESVKNKLKEKLAGDRWTKEVLGTSVTVQGHEINIDTSRENRYIFNQQYLIMNDNDTTLWKFSNIWLNLSKSDVLNIIISIKNHVQSSFDWENSIIAQIDQAQDLETLDNIDWNT